MSANSLFLIAACLLAVAAAIPATTTTTFAMWKSEHGKMYSDSTEETHRAAIWKRNDNYITKMNMVGNTFTLGHNAFSDLTHQEFKSLYLNSKNMAQKSPSITTVVRDPYHATGGELPASVDWRTEGWVTPVKNQGQCGSCWSFSTTGSLEGQWFNKTKNLVSLSEQNLVDCSQSQGNQGCNGGLMDDAFKYIMDNKGIDTEASYPYTARDGKCAFNPANVGATVSGFRDVISGDESNLQDAVANVGPVSIAIDAALPTFQLYHSGVYAPKLCSSTKLDHGVLAAGYGTLNGVDYWLVKNSWGPTWGQEGYILMARNQNNLCGVATSASFPLV